MDINYICFLNVINWKKNVKNVLYGVTIIITTTATTNVHQKKNFVNVSNSSKNKVNYQ